MAKSGPHNTIIKGAEANNTVNNSGGTAGRSISQRPIPGPENPGPPISMRKALARKPGSSRGTDSPGLIR